MTQQHFSLNVLLLFGLFAYAFTVQANSANLEDPYTSSIVISNPQDTIPLNDRYGDFINNQGTNPFDLNDPAIIDQEVEYDPVTNQYIITEKIGEDFYRAPTYMSFQEYLDYRAKQQERDYFNRLSGISGGDRSASGKVDPIADIDVKKDLIDRLFGGTEVDIKPQGNIDLTFGVDYSYTENPSWTERQRRQGGFDFDMAIQMNVTGKIGDKLNLSTNYNTQATFDFDNQMKLDYDTDAFSEDEIIKKIEAGNVSMPLRGSLIQGSQSLFGLKTELQFGHLRITALASQQKSEQKDIVIQNGSQFQEFEVYADDYDENRNFFLAHYFRENFEESLENLPQIKSLVTIERIDVWLTNDRNDVNGGRDIVAIADLGEHEERTSQNNVIPVRNPPRYLDVTGETGLPDNNANNLYDNLIDNPLVRKIDRTIATLQNLPFNLTQARDFEKVNARLLRQGQEYTVHPQLGYISLNVNVRPDQVVGVAFQYSYNGKTYKVGELSNNVPSTSAGGNTRDPNDPVTGPVTTDTLNDQNVLFVKMLKSTTPRVDLPTWDLMMKNFYSIGAYQVNQDDFLLDVYYEDPGQGQKRFLPTTNLAGVPLLRVFNLDQLNVQGDPQPDGIFDFVQGVTITPRNGRVMFPVLEPFGKTLAEKITTDQLEANIVYNQLYDSTLTVAREYPHLNRFTIKGSYRSSVSSEISLGAFNIPRGSVRVTVGGQVLREGTDYEIDYNIGRVKVLRDDLLNSGAPIRVSFEDNTLFGFQTKTMVGLRADYELGDNFNIGGTYLHLFERPYTQKVNIGDDPINNRIYGLDVNFSKEAPWLTKAVDAVPFLNTKAASNITFSAEAAALKPGHAKAINEQSDDGNKGGIVYLDDFEGSASTFDLRTPATEWVMASVPQNDENNRNPLFPESREVNNLISGVNRAHLNWFRADRSLVANDEADPYVALVPQTEVFPNLQQTPDRDNNIQVFDLHYKPDERGPYNFDVPDGTQYSSGLTSNGGLKDPENRWAGIMRDLNTNDFEAANIEAVEFWMMSPFLDSPGDPDREGEIYLNLGNVSEDILRDSRKFFENGLPTPSNPGRRVDTTTWSVIPIGPQVNYAFDNNSEARAVQDVGFDGMDDAAEQRYFRNFINTIQSSDMFQFAKDSIINDPSNDNFAYYNNSDYYDENSTLLDRYSRFNGPQGNSPITQGSSTREQASQYPDYEDLNQDNTLSETESYHQYRIPIRADGEEIDMESNPYIIDRQVSERTFTTASGNTVNRYWYRFKIPINDINKTSVGGIQGFRSIRFIRMYMNGFKKPVVLRFARLGLIRNQWRKYTQLPLSDPDAAVLADGTPTTFDVTAVNIEENSNREPFNYVLPEGIQREQNLGVFNALQNEQSLSIRTCNLQNGDARGIYKLLNLDMRLYDRLKMFVHAEADDTDQVSDIQKGDLKLFIRLGSDFISNYYEYEIPLEMSDPNINSSGPADLEYTREVWKAENELDIPLDSLIELKKQRNRLNIPLNKIYEGQGDFGNGTAKIIGNPNLGLVKSVMIGVRNPYTEDGNEYCSEVWINELRVNGLDERGGAAAIARLDMQLADFGNVTLAGNISTIGFGSLDQKLIERNREEIKGFDVATNLELGKFLPEKTGIRVPFYAQYSQQISTPEYDPYDLDIVLKDKLAEETDAATRDTIRNRAETATTIKSYSFTNVRKERTGDSKPMPWDVSNFSFTYAHNQTEERTPLIESEKVDDYRGAVDYTYSSPLKPIKPFKKVKNKNLKFIKEINFNPVPNSFSFSTVMDRQFAETKYRFTDLAPQFSTFHNKRFTWDRNYNLNWDLMKALKMTYNANMNTVIDEPFEYNPETFERIDTEVRNDSIWTNIKDFGRPKNFQQQINVNYTLPFNNFPYLDWISAKVQYSGDYSWNAASLNTQHLGNIIQNNQNRSISGDLNFEKIYNYSKYLKKINAKPRRGNKRKATTNRGKKKPTGKDDDGKDKKGKKEKKDREPTKMERALIRPLLLVRKARFNYGETFSTVVPGFRPETKFLGMNETWDAPGWDFVAGLQPNIRGLEEDDYYTDKDWLYNLSQNSYVVDTIFLNQQVQQNYSQKIDAKLTIEPFPDFRIDIEANRNFSESHTEYFKDTTSLVDRREERFANGFYTPTYSHAVPRDLGSMTMTYYALNTLFQDSDEQITDLFAKFEQNRKVVSQRLGTGQHDDPAQALKGYTDGYGEVNQDVLIPSFLAAYKGQDINSVEVSQNYVRDVLFKELPDLNWKLSYNGLSKLPLFKDVFQSFSLSHGYRSTLTVNSFATSIDYLSERASGRDGLNDLTLDFYSRIELPEVAISEQFSPLLGIDMKLKNDMSFNVDYKKSRTLAMSFVTSILAETQSEEFVIGFGYRLKDFEIPFLSGSKKKKKGKKPTADDAKDKKPKPGRNNRGGGSGEPKDLNINFDFSIRNNVTFQHYLDQNIKEPTRGYREISISPAAEYQLNEQLSLRFFFDYVRNIPRVSSSFPRTNSQGGVTVRFSLN